MNFDKYNELKKMAEKLNIHGYFAQFDPEMHKISENKIICIMPNGECLFFPYNANDNKKRNQENRDYGHRQYLVIVLEQILEKLKKNKEEFIKWEFLSLLDIPDAAEFVIAIIENLGVSIIYNIGWDEDGNNRQIYLEKSKDFTIKQKDTIISMRKPLENDKYVIAVIEFVQKDDEIERLGFPIHYARSGMVYIDANKSRDVYGDIVDPKPFSVEEFYEVLEKIRISQDYPNQVERGADYGFEL